MSAVLYVGSRVESGLVASRRISPQHTVATFFAVEVALLFLCGIAPSFYLEAFGVSRFVAEQFESQTAVTAIGVAVYVIAACLLPVYSAAHIFDARLNIRRLVLVCLATFGTLVAVAAATKTTQNYSRVWFFTWCATATELILFARLCGLVWVQMEIAAWRVGLSGNKSWFGREAVDAGAAACSYRIQGPRGQIRSAGKSFDS
jgi:hypothetical protein